VRTAMKSTPSRNERPCCLILPGPTLGVTQWLGCPHLSNPRRSSTSWAVTRPSSHSPRFYAGVDADPEMRALTPEEDLADAEEWLPMFLEQHWGGPNTCSQLSGHPCLRMRHAPFAVTSEDARPLAELYARGGGLTQPVPRSRPRIVDIRRACRVHDGQTFDEGSGSDTDFRL
jgi:hypothetical protein